MFALKSLGKWFSFFGVLFLVFPMVPAAFCSAGEALSLDGRYAVSAAIGRDRAGYHVAESENGLEADNPAQSYRASFSPEGVEFRSGTAAWGLGLTEYGYGQDLRAVEPAKPSAVENRVEYSRGALTEWYVNGPYGLQQGFTLAEAPAGRAEGERLRLRLELRGALTAEVNEDRRGLVLRDETGTVRFGYGGLTVFDAEGREAPTRLEASADRIEILVNDEGLRYPLTIDPVVQKAKLTASDGLPGDSFGWSVAVDGDTMVVGAQGDDSARGSAYVFVKDGAGWTQSVKLTASDRIAGNRFGWSVAISGDTVVVGAPFHSPGGIIGQGAAYVFVGTGAGWSQMAKLTASDGATYDYFGMSVAVSGDTVVIGANGDDIGGNPDQGSAYVFVKPGGGWSDTNQTAKLTASDGVASDEFGDSVAIDGDTVVVGAYHADIDGIYNQGAAYVFVKPGVVWADTTQTAKLRASDGAANDQFGYSVAVSGDTVAVGANDVVNHQGAAYVYLKPANGWTNMTQTTRLFPTNGGNGDGFGASIAADGDRVVVGANEDSNGLPVQGSAYMFVKPGGGWPINMTETTKLVASDGAAMAYFGLSVAISGGTVVVGSRDNLDKGAAYVFEPPYTLTANFSGAGNGTVTSQPAGIACPGTCTADFADDASVTLSAVPAFGSVLVGWTGAPCPGNGDCTVTMTGDLTVTARFGADTDADGIADDVEELGPNNGDGNFDSIRDSRQPHVTTFQDAAGMWVTLVSDSGGPLVQVTAMPDPDPAGKPNHVTVPCGLFKFRLQGLAPGAETAATLIMHTPEPNVNSYWKYGPTADDPADHWYEFLYDGTTGAEVFQQGGKTIVTLHLKDGALGDGDLAADGVIIDPGAPAVDTTITGGGGGGGGVTPATSSGGGGGCFLSLF